MVTGQAPLFETFPDGYPAAVVAGRSAVLKIFIPDQPVASERPRGRVVNPPGKSPFVQFYMPKKTKDYMEHVATIARGQLLKVEVDGDDSEFTLPMKECRILAHLRFNLDKPVSYPKSVIHSVTKPDIDNLVKSVLDGLVQGRVMLDDNCITDLMVSKRYVSPGHPTGVEIELTCLPI